MLQLTSSTDSWAFGIYVRINNLPLGRLFDKFNEINPEVTPFGMQYTGY